MSKKLLFSSTMILPLFFLLLSGCKQNNKSTKWQDTPVTGVVPIACDESFRPVIDDEIAVFESLYSYAGIIPIYTDEVEAIELLKQDSVRLAVLSRTLTDGEKATFDNKKMVVRNLKIAVDAIALIVNKNNPDSIIGVPTLKKILTGEITQWSEINPKSQLGDIDVIFDHPNSSTVRFMIDSICRGEPLSQNLYAQNSNLEVIEKVAEIPGAMGIIGVNWISNDKDSTNMSFNDKITVMAVGRYAGVDNNNTYKPYQAYIALGYYPLTRDIYILLSDPRRGLSSGFANFVTSDRGQRVIKRAGILPATQPINLVQVTDKPIF